MIPLKRKEKGNIQGIQYTSDNLSEILKIGFIPRSSNPQINLGDMTISYEDLDGVFHQIFLNDWIVHDVVGSRIIREHAFKQMYEPLFSERS